MDTALSGLIILVLLLVMVFTFGHGYLSMQDTTLESWRELQARLADQSRTDLTPVGAETQGGGALAEVTLRNDGDVKLSDYPQWDVIVEYDASTSDHIIAWLPYQGSAENRWLVEGLYHNAAADVAEVFEPSVLNPGEEIVIQMWLSPTVGTGTTNRVTVVSPNGVSASMVFTN